MRFAFPATAVAILLVAAIVLGMVFGKIPTSTNDGTDVPVVLDNSQAEGRAYAARSQYGEIDLRAENVFYSIGVDERDQTDFPIYFEDIASMILPSILRNEYPNDSYSEFKTIVVKDIEQADGMEVRYVTDDKTDGIVTTKWMFWYFYRYAVFSGYGDHGAEATADEGRRMREECWNDDYCMEKVNVDVLSLVRQDAGKSVRDFTEEERAALDEMMGSNYSDESAAFPAPYLRDPITSNRTEVAMAAWARYGAFDPEAILSDELAVRGLYVTVHDETGETYAVTLRVVGFVETEADKLLSTGVSMDEESEAYQTVVEQLRHPVFYSVDGNVMTNRG